MEEILGILDSEQRRKFCDLLYERGFRVGEQGHIGVVNPLPKHPYWQGSLPVGFLGGSGRIYLTNIDLTFPRNYHQEIKEIYNETIK